MAKFYLIQRGAFKNSGKSLTGSDGVVNLDYMGSAEFEWGAIPKAYRRLMYHFEEYDVFHTEIYTPEHEELMVFCRKDCSTEVIQAIREFVEQPYNLKEYSELEKVPKAKKETHHTIGAAVISGGALMLENCMETGWRFYNLSQIYLQRL